MLRACIRCTRARRSAVDAVGEGGRGGMGQVYLCEHVVMRRQVAVKILRPEVRARVDVRPGDMVEVEVTNKFVKGPITCYNTVGDIKGLKFRKSYGVAVGQPAWPTPRGRFAIRASSRSSLPLWTRCSCRTAPRSDTRSHSRSTARTSRTTGGSPR